jgi:predicted DNA-binding transcriptional regulator YafY
MNRKESEKKVKLSRIARIDEEIRSGRYPNSEELAAKMEVTPRTILRDIDYLRTMYDAPIEYDFNKRGFYYTEPNFFIKSIMLTKDEIETITIHNDFLKFADSDEHNIKLRKVIGKVLAVVPEEQTKDLSFSPSENKDFMFEPTMVFPGDIIHELQSAMDKKETVELEYWISDNKQYTLHTLDPLYIFFQRHVYYLLAYKHGSNSKPGIYSITRMRKLRKTGDHFEIPTEFKAKDYLKKEADVTPADNKIYTFELSFHKEIASYAIEQTYYHNQEIKLCEDGTVFLRFRSTRLLEVYHWVLAGGYRVKVINPPELLTMIKREIKKIGEYYT